jgi:hypothetical protein
MIIEQMGRRQWNLERLFFALTNARARARALKSHSPDPVEAASRSPRSARRTVSSYPFPFALELARGPKFQKNEKKGKKKRRKMEERARTRVQRRGD